jgi:hypothetical protein
MLMRAELANKRKGLSDKASESERMKYSKKTIKQIVQRETEIEAENLEMSQILKRRNHTNENEGLEVRRHKNKLDLVSAKGHTPVLSELNGDNHLTGSKLGQNSPNYSHFSTLGNPVVSKGFPSQKISSKLKQTIISSLQISNYDQAQSMKLKNEPRGKATTPVLPSTTNGKVQYNLSTDPAEKFNIRNSVDSTNFSKLVDRRASHFGEVQRINDGRAKENHMTQSTKVSYKTQSSNPDKQNEALTSLEQNSRLPAIKRMSIARNPKPTGLNPWKATK